MRRRSDASVPSPKSLMLTAMAAVVSHGQADALREGTGPLGQNICHGRSVLEAPFGLGG